MAHITLRKLVEHGSSRLQLRTIVNMLLQLRLARHYAQCPASNSDGAPCHAISMFSCPKSIRIIWSFFSFVSLIWRIASVWSSSFCESFTYLSG